MFLNKKDYVILRMPHASGADYLAFKKGVLFAYNKQSGEQVAGLEHIEIRQGKARDRKIKGSKSLFNNAAT
jgi:hypothetical protein